EAAENAGVVLADNLGRRAAGTDAADRSAATGAAGLPGWRRAGGPGFGADRGIERSEPAARGDAVRDSAGRVERAARTLRGTDGGRDRHTDHPSRSRRDQRSDRAVR